MRTIISISLLALALSCTAEKIDKKTFDYVMIIADIEGIPRSIAANLMREESGGDADAISHPTKAGYRSKGLFQLYDEPRNMTYLLAKFWHESREFEVFSPIDNATIAFRYLAALHRQIGSWERALWFYNCGRFTDPPESTRHYAARIIGRE